MGLWQWLRRPREAAPPPDPKMNIVVAPPGELLDLRALQPVPRRVALLSGVISPALAWLLVRGVKGGADVQQFMITITGHEADARFRRQHGNGPARGLWQFERGGGVAGVLTHKASKDHAADACRFRGVEASATAVHAALERDDILAAIFARLLIFTDPAPIPTDEQSALFYYLRTWRPGAWTRGGESERIVLRRRWADEWVLAQTARNNYYRSGGVAL